MRMHVLHFFSRNSTEFRGIFFVGVDVFSGVLWFLKDYGILRNLHLWRDYFHFLQYGISRIFFAGVACFDFVRRFIIDLMHTLYIASLRNSTEFAFMKRFFLRMHVLHFFFGILRNSTEFVFMKRFFIRMHVLPFLRNSTEFRGIFFVGVDVFMVCFDYVGRFRLNACIVFLRNSTEFAFMKRLFSLFTVRNF